MNMGTGLNFQPVFKALYQNPNGEIINVSQKAIDEATTTAAIRKSVDTAFKENPEYYYKYKNANDEVKFIIDGNGKCFLMPSDFTPSKQMYQGETKFGVQQGKPTEIATQRMNCEYKDHFSDEVGSIRKNGIGEKYAHIQKDYSVNITYPEWAPKDE